MNSSEHFGYFCNNLNINVTLSKRKKNIFPRLSYLETKFGAYFRRIKLLPELSLIFNQWCNMVKYASRLKNVTVKNTIRKRKGIISTYWLSERAGRENIWPEVMDGFFRPSSRHRVRPSYGDFLNSFAMKARARPYGSYVNRNSYSNPWV